jgi:hypothetical protein
MTELRDESPNKQSPNKHRLKMENTVGPTEHPNTEQPNHEEAVVQAEPSLVEVLDSYSAAGFDGDAFATEGGMILCGSCQSKLSPDHIDVHSIRRLEGTSDPSDNIGVVAIVCPVCKSQATMVLKYGPEASPDEVAIWHQTNDRRTSTILPADMPPSEHEPHVGPPVHATPTRQPELPPPTEFE